MSVTSDAVGQLRAKSESRVSGGGLNWSVTWAWIGAIWFAIITYSMTMWIVSGQATPVVPGDGEPWRQTLFYWLERGMLVLALLSVATFVIAPKIKTGRMSTTGLIVLAFGTLWYQDPLLNYIVPYGVFSSLFTNWGSWSAFFPGAVGPNIHLVPEPPLFQASLYFTAMPGIVFAVLWAMRTWKSWYPQASTATLIAVGFAFGAVWDLILELPAVYLQIWAYPGAIEAFTWWPGEAHQFPWYEAPMLGAMFAAMAMALMSRNDRGQMFCERGIERVTAGEGRKTLIRFLGLVGILQTLYFTTYNIPTWLVSLHSSAWPADFPKHLVNNICGPDVGIPCPGPGVPYTRAKHGVVVTPDGPSIDKRPAPAFE